MLVKDIFPKFFNFNQKFYLTLTRITTFILLIIALLFVKKDFYSTIIRWNFLSMGLRGTTIFFPLLFAMFFKKCISYSHFGFWAITLAPLSMIVWKIIYPNGLNPVLIGLAISLFILLGITKIFLK